MLYVSYDNHKLKVSRNCTKEKEIKAYNYKI